MMGKFVECTIKEVENLYKQGTAPSHSTICRRIELAKAALGKQKHQILSLHEFCQYYDMDISE